MLSSGLRTLNQSHSIGYDAIGRIESARDFPLKLQVNIFRVEITLSIRFRHRSIVHGSLDKIQ